jgi:hypothetical protein
MIKLRYNVCSPIRLILPLAGGLLVVPFLIPEVRTVFFLPFFLLFPAYFILLNFPSIAESLHSRPVYFEDLSIVARGMGGDATFQKVYTILMNIILAIIFTGVVEYTVLKGFDNQSFAEILGTVGGNVAIFASIQNYIGRKLISLCYTLKSDDTIRDHARSAVDILNIDPCLEIDVTGSNLPPARSRSYPDIEILIEQRDRSMHSHVTPVTR